MNYRPAGKWLTRILVVLCIMTLLFLGGTAWYGAHVGASARALIDSAAAIQSTADAERQIAAWRGRTGRRFWDESVLPSGDHSYTVQIDNGSCSYFGIASPTVVEMVVTLRNQELRNIILVMFTGKEPKTTSGVWIQEWFGDRTFDGFHVNPKDRPLKATVEFSAGLRDAERLKAFALNTDCFLRLGGCKSAEEILPGVWQLSSDQQVHD